jgi:tRNA pseudouridine55 synthase
MTDDSGPSREPEQARSPHRATRREPALEVSGVLNIDKPLGLSSHDVVNRVRRITNQKRIGHTGTLDPAATGVLVLCLGQATRIAEYVTDARKVYRATVRLGITTSTWDREGEVTGESDIADLTLAAIEGALGTFVGEIWQVPPMYSAIKHEGKPLYKLARRGVDVEREPRQVTIYALELEAWQPPDLTLRVICSKGTYIRALAYDLGQALGPGAHLAGLRRLAVGQLVAEDAISLDTLHDAEAGGAWQRYVRPMRDALQHMPSVVLQAADEARVRFGQTVALQADADQGLHCAYDANGELIAILRFSVAQAAWQPIKVLSVRAP